MYITSLALLTGFILGTILGSLAKALADRSLEGKSFWGRSKCSSCQHILAPLDLVPVWSFLFLRGRCRYCSKKISLEYLLVEVILGGVVALLFYQTLGNFPLSFNYQWTIVLLTLLGKVFFITTLTIIFITDFKKMFVPDRIILPAIAGLSLFLAGWNVGDFLGGFACGLVIALVFTTLIVITRGRGMGFGDVKLGLFLGIGLGFPNGFLAVILAFLSGAIVSLAVVLAGQKSLKSQIPFGPFLALGGVVTLLWGQWILDWYLQLKLSS